MKQCKVKFEIFLKAALREIFGKAVGASRSQLPSHQREADFHDLACMEVGSMDCVVLLWLAIEPTNLKRFLLSRTNGQPEAAGDEQMAPAKIPCVGVPPVTKCGEPEEQEAALPSLTNVSRCIHSATGQGWEVAVPLNYDLSICTWSGKLKQGAGTSCWVVG